MRSKAVELVVRVFFCFLGSLALQIPAGAQSWSNGYTYRRAITIDHTKVPNTDQTNFPVLISGTYSYLATTSNGGNVTSANGYDIIFTSDATGTNVLPFEVESYDPTSGAVVYWVQTPTVSHTADTALYVFYGNASVTTDQSNKTAVWDSDYVGVWHFSNGTTLSGADSTSHAYSLTNNNNTGATSGQIDGAASFNGSSNYLSNSSVSIASGSSITVSFWNYVTSPNSQGSFAFTIGGSDDPDRISAAVPWTNNTLYWDYGASSSGRVSTGYGSYLGSWTHVVLKYDASSSTHYIYLNGSLATSNVNSSSPQAAQTGIDIGEWLSYFENGKIDEFRVSNIARSGGWITAEYNNQNSPSSFYSVGSADSGGGSSNPSITGLAPSSGPAGIPVTINGLNFGSTQGSSTVAFNGTAVTPTSWTSTYIVANVPPGATTGAFVVTVSGVASTGSTFTVTTDPGIISLSPTSGLVGISVTIGGVNFGSIQGTSTVSFNGTTASVISWNTTAITAVVPSGASSGPVLVTVSSQVSNGVAFTVTPIPAGWTDADIGSVGLPGSASYINGAFTVQAAGNGMAGTADGMNFLYQPLSGDGTIVARIVSTQRASNSVYAGVMIRETLAAGASNAFLDYWAQLYVGAGSSFTYRASTDGSVENGGGGTSNPPFWLKLVRSGSTFTAYSSTDGISWTQLGSQTITMAQNVYIGLAVSSGSTSSLSTATFDNVSISTPSNPAPAITSVLPDGGVVGSQAVISGSGFGATQGNSIVTLNDAPVTVSSWSDSSITFTIPAGAVSGLLAVSVAPSMNSSNAVVFLVGSQTLSGWVDADLGTVGTAGSASYVNGVFTVQAAGNGMAGTADGMNFLYQPLSGDGTIVARIVSTQRASNSVYAGVMIRETLAAGASNAFLDYWAQLYVGAGSSFTYRASTDGSVENGGGGTSNPPFWLKLVRSGSTFTAYSSTDGISWTQLGSQTITMAQNVYIGLAVSSGSTSSLSTATFDNVSISTPSNPAPAITSVLPDGG
jgi:regulation of enolase protein 1 (concanavalin A-like superfamily)